MMDERFFMHQIKHNKNNDQIDKGIVVKETYDGAKQSYHAFLGAYAYKNDASIDFVQCMITDITGATLMEETWKEAGA